MSGIGDPTSGTGDMSETGAVNETAGMGETGEPPWDVKLDGNRRRPTTAEQAVPWLIGLVLALAGMLVVLLALIFSTTDGALTAFGTPTPEPTLAATPRPTQSPRPTPEPTASAEPSPTAAPTPAFAPLEILFMQRISASGPVHLFSHDFALSDAPEALAREDRGIDRYAWAPNGTWGITLVEGDPVSVNPGVSASDLGDGFDGVAFAADSITAYAVRATLAGANDQAELLSVDVTTGVVQSLQTWVYPHPVTFQQSAVEEAQFSDDGGFNRVYVLNDGRVVVWILGAPAIYTFDPATGTASTTNREPLLWSPNGLLRVEAAQSGGSTTLTLRGLANEARGSITVSGLVSHLRWSAQQNNVVFTLTTALAGGGAAQDLYLWDLRGGSSVVRVTQDNRSSAGEFRGVWEYWKP